ncbi:MAG: ribosomal RNA small subunit methyltransferase A [Dinghuibacter sp.]|nr:ribosomal RNA small subunit methyltransferase A [Dinghuibacter sp.]
MVTLKKSLGQHFLTDGNICRKIIDHLPPQAHEWLLEVGPGGGALTRFLLEMPVKGFKAVEVDDEKVQYLLQHYPQLQGRIIHESFLDITPPFEQPFYIVGNFPYNISTQILFKVLDWPGQVTGVTGMFQKEVAQRVAAPEGSKTYGVTSVLVQAFFDVQYLFEVHEHCFNPPPKVKSAVIQLVPKKEPVAIASREAFFSLVKTAFNQRRKTLRNAVKQLFAPDVLNGEIFNKRAEQLSVHDFAALSFKMNKHAAGDDHRQGT